jgi:hypothetical protein
MQRVFIGCAGSFARELGLVKSLLASLGVPVQDHAVLNLAESRESESYIAEYSRAPKIVLRVEALLEC